MRYNDILKQSWRYVVVTADARARRQPTGSEEPKNKREWMAIILIRTREGGETYLRSLLSVLIAILSQSQGIIAHRTLKIENPRRSSEAASWTPAAQ